MKPTLDGQRVVWEREFDGHDPVVFAASDIRQTNTGPHAKVVLSLNGRILAYDVFNLGRHGDRGRLANAVHANLGGDSKNPDIQALYPKPELRHELDVFCLGVWSAWMDETPIVMLAGDSAENPIEYLAHPHVLTGGGTILFGPPEAGKSWTAMLMAVAIDAGLGLEEGLGWTVIKAKTLLINLERSGRSIARRLEGVNLALGLEPDRPLATLNARGRTLKDKYDQIKAYVDRENIQFLVLDSLTRGGLGDLTENATGNNAGDMLNRLCETWLAIGHAPRGDTTHIFGSIMFEAAADIMVRCVGEKVGNLALATSLEVTKINDGPRVEPMYLEYGFDAAGLTSAKVVSLAEVPALAAVRMMSWRDQILECLANDMAQATAGQLRDKLELPVGRAKASAFLANDPRISKTTRTKDGQYYSMTPQGL
jgi:hypothetical protein